MQKASLVTLAHSASSILSMLYESGGEDTPELQAAIAVQAETEVALAAKVDAYHFVLESLKTEKESLKRKAEMFAKVAKACENKEKQLKENIKLAMKLLGTEEISGELFRFQNRPTDGRIEVDKKELDPAYLMTVTDKVPDMERIAADVVAGKTVKGAVHVPGSALYTYVARANKAPKKEKAS